VGLHETKNRYKYWRGLLSCFVFLIKGMRCLTSNHSMQCAKFGACAVGWLPLQRTGSWYARCGTSWKQCKPCCVAQIVFVCLIKFPRRLTDPRPPKGLDCSCFTYDLPCEQTCVPAFVILDRWKKNLHLVAGTKPPKLKSSWTDITKVLIATCTVSFFLKINPCLPKQNGSSELESSVKTISR